MKRNSKPRLNAVATAMPELAGQVGAALRAGQIEAWVQPKVALRPGKVVGGEVLARWVHPEHGVIAPGRFMHLIEAQGLKDELLLGQLDAVLPALRGWPRGLTVAFNVDARQLCNPGLVAELCRRVVDAGVAPDRVEIELTEEDSALATLDDALHAAFQIRRMGMALVLDDLGAAHSGLALLAELPFTAVKLDRLFVESLAASPTHEAIASAVIGLGLQLGLPVVAEGVETEWQRDRLMRLGCCYGQGYRFGKPMPLRAFSGAVSGGA